MLNIIEIIHTVQGETSLAGIPTTLIRLGGCNLRCRWCDTTHAFEKGTITALSDIIAIVRGNACSHVCVTGGEPLLQPNVYPLMRQLCDEKYTVSLETSGALTIEKVDPRVITILDIKCPGSGMDNKNYWENLSLLREQDEVKFVLTNENDYAYAVDRATKYGLFTRSKPVLLSPAHGILEPKQLVTWILRDSVPARLNMQIHKVIWSPETKGV